MIAVEKIIEGPPRVNPEVTIATDTQVEEITAAKIKDVVGYVKKSFRARGHYGYTLIALTNQDFLEIDSIGKDPQPPKYKVERQRGQGIIMNLMKKFGLDESKYKERTGNSFFHEEADYEIRWYPTTVRGMFFRRERTYYRDSGETFKVRWNVEPHVAIFKFNPIEAFAKSIQRS